MGRVLARIVTIQTELLEELSDIDRDVQELVDRRAVVTALLVRCRDAMGGIGNPYIPRVPLPTEIDAEPSGTQPVSGPELRSALRHILRTAGRELTIGELHRGLLARGMRAPDPTSHSISNALGVEVGRGTIRRTRPGAYVTAEEHEPAPAPSREPLEA